jgi:eukaryotic-like serine/threonine-protein kinase
MKQGDLLGGYLVCSKPTNAGGGKCVWAFATKDGEEYFIKEFLEPKWPLSSSPGSAESKRRRREDCTAFEGRHRHVMNRLKSDAVGGGNIVIAEAFFREGTTYYKVTRRIDASNLTSLVPLTVHQKLVVLRTLGLSLQQLHRIDVVHGDLKPDNVLVQKRPSNNLYTAKLIDFDDSYVTGHPPAGTTVGGDSMYGAPEWFSYIRQDVRSDGGELTTAVDMFSLGLMVHEYLTGQLPGFPPEFGSPGEAVKAGRRLVLCDRLHPEIARLIVTLTDSRPQRRPDIDAFLTATTDESRLEFPCSVAASGSAAPRGGGRLIINMGVGVTDTALGAERKGAPSAPARDAGGDRTDRASRPSRLRIHLDVETPAPPSSGPDRPLTT